MGEKLASLLGITTPKYQYAIDEYYRMKKEVGCPFFEFHKSACDPAAVYAEAAARTHTNTQLGGIKHIIFHAGGGGRGRKSSGRGSRASL